MHSSILYMKFIRVNVKHRTMHGEQLQVVLHAYRISEDLYGYCTSSTPSCSLVRTLSLPSLPPFSSSLCCFCFVFLARLPRSCLCISFWFRFLYWQQLSGAMSEMSKTYEPCSSGLIDIYKGEAVPTGQYDNNNKVRDKSRERVRKTKVWLAIYQRSLWWNAK